MPIWNWSFDEFIQKEKFLEDLSIFYPGQASPELRKILSDRINRTAKDFQQTSLKPGVSTDEYLAAIKRGLDRFDELYLDTEDRERVCHYVEELMDMVGLESSGGLLNTFMYGFDPEDWSK